MIKLIIAARGSAWLKMNHRHPEDTLCMEPAENLASPTYFSIAEVPRQPDDFQEQDRHAKVVTMHIQKQYIGYTHAPTCISNLERRPRCSRGPFPTNALETTSRIENGPS